jgi:hypothetical protein
MRFTHMFAFGLLLALPVFFIQFRVESNDGILSRLHYHADCEAKQTVVRLPAQEIRIDAPAPRVTVGSHRTRGFMPTGPAFMPVVGGPFVATILPLSTVTPTAPGNPALRALHDLEAQAGDAAAAVAAHKAHMDHLNAVHKRIQANLSTTFGASTSETSLQKSLDDLTKRVSDIERLLIVHDNILKEKFGGGK